MKSRFLRRAGSFLLALALACSLLTVPAAADDPTTDPPAQPVLVSGISLPKQSFPEYREPENRDDNRNGPAGRRHRQNPGMEKP